MIFNTPNQPGRIELQVQDTSRYFLPAETFIEVEGLLTKDDNNPYTAVQHAGFVNNGIVALFKSVIYMIDGKEIDVATTILGLARYSDDYTRSAGPSMMFAKDTVDFPDHRNAIMGRVRNAADTAEADAVTSIKGNYNLGFAARKAMLNNGGQFSCVIPVSHIFGFCRDVHKVIFGAKHRVVLVRKPDANDAIWRDRDAGDLLPAAARAADVV